MVAAVAEVATDSELRRALRERVKHIRITVASLVFHGPQLVANGPLRLTGSARAAGSVHGSVTVSAGRPAGSGPHTVHHHLNTTHTMHPPSRVHR